MIANYWLDSIFWLLATIFIYQFFAIIQQRSQLIWLNPMLLSIMTIIPLLLINNLSFDYYFQSTQWLNSLLEPAVVALGFPLYQHLHNIKNQWRNIFLLLLLAMSIVISISFLLTIWLITSPEIAISLSLKSVTTPIGIALTEQFNGNSAITAFAIILAGLFGGLLGPSWLNFINVRSSSAQGMAIGAASHALGTAIVSKHSYEHGAYSSMALIICAVFTAIISPFLLPLLIFLVNP